MSLLKIVSPKFVKYCPILRTEGKFTIMVDDACCHLSCYTSTHASIWHHYGYMAPRRQQDNGVTTLNYWGHVTSSVFAVGDFLWVVDCDHASITLSCTVIEI